MFKPTQRIGPYSKWSITPCLREHNVASKTGTFDDTIIVGESIPARAWTAKLFPILLRRRPLVLFAPLVRDVASELGISAQRVCPHMCRHGGPSTDMLSCSASTSP